jgi:hypothetical protein
MDLHPLEDLIGLRSLLGDKCIDDLEHVVALHAQAIVTVFCEDPKLRALLEVVLASWLSNQTGPLAFVGGNNPTGVRLEGVVTAQSLGWTLKALDARILEAQHNCYLTVKCDDTYEFEPIYDVDFLPLLQPSLNALRIKLDRSWRAVYMQGLSRLWRETNTHLEWQFANLDLGKALGRHLKELEQEWRALIGRTGAHYDLAPERLSAESLHSLLDELIRINEKIVAISGEHDFSPPEILLKQANFRAHHRWQAFRQTTVVSLAERR